MLSGHAFDEQAKSNKGDYIKNLFCVMITGLTVIDGSVRVFIITYLRKD